jgi:maltose alpha-D-glucosyltransferase/alpha-amylase
MLENEPLWYKDAIIYQVHVRAYHDSIGDGVGDFRGLTQKLDYLQDLGVTTIWLLPFYPSPLKDDGYDIADYTNIHPQYGTLRDFREFLEAAHQRGLRVITELVINHTSDQHPWFERARRSPPGSKERDFYVWSDTPERYKEARIIFQDFEHSNWAWDPVAKAYFWHRFYSHQPDLNYDNPAVWEAIFPLMDFWMKMGVDGMRLDAVPYLYEREGTNCENLSETHTFLKALRRHVDASFSQRMLLAEANQWPEDAVSYFGNGDECHMAFHFPVMPRLFMSIHMEDRFPIIDIMAQTPPLPDNCQWAMFLRNHDELTLEMVTDEERDYMYRAYALEPRARINLGIRRRLAPLLGNNRRRIELMKGLLFSLPGTPVLYYGDEIGMGDNIFLGDRNGVRTPMQWSADRNAGFSRANPQRLFLPVIIDPEYHYESINVEAQQNNPNSLLWWMKRLIALRKRYKAFGRGTLEFLHPDNRKILAFLRRFHEETILVVANLSRFVQYVELDMSAFQGQVPVELFGRNAFPPIGKQPYLLTLGPHSFYWFSVEKSRAQQRAGPASDGEVPIPVLIARGNWEALFSEATRDRLEEVLPGFLQPRIASAVQNQVIKATTIREAFRIRFGESAAFLVLVDVEWHDGNPATFMLPMALEKAEIADRLLREANDRPIARVQGDVDGYVFDALVHPGFTRALLEAIAEGRSYPVLGGELTATAYGKVDLSSAEGLSPIQIRSARTKTYIRFGNLYYLKVFRRAEEGTNPELELGRYLTQKHAFAHIIPVLGAIEYRPRRGDPITVAILQAFVPNEGNYWQYTLDDLSRYFERVLALPAAEQQTPPLPGSLLELARQDPPQRAQELIGNYLQSARHLGKRTAEFHLALAPDLEGPTWAPEPFTTLYQRSLYQSLRNVKREMFDKIQQALRQMPENVRALAQRVLESEEKVLHRFRSLVGHKITAQRSRIHGDYHLGHVLNTGKDVLVIGLEGDPSRSIGERRVKRSPLRDVVGMISSFHFAASSALVGNVTRRGRSPGVVRPEDLAVLEPWSRFWYAWVSAAFLKGYQEAAASGHFLPRAPEQLRVLFDVLLLEEALGNMEYALTGNQDIVALSLAWILQLLEAGV